MVLVLLLEVSLCGSRVRWACDEGLLLCCLQQLSAGFLRLFTKWLGD